jgi:hypothetical protein
MRPSRSSPVTATITFPTLHLMGISRASDGWILGPVPNTLGSPITTGHMDSSRIIKWPSVRSSGTDGGTVIHIRTRTEIRLSLAEQRVYRSTRDLQRGRGE